MLLPLERVFNGKELRSIYANFKDYIKGSRSNADKSRAIADICNYGQKVHIFVLEEMDIEGFDMVLVRDDFLDGLLNSKDLNNVFQKFKKELSGKKNNNKRITSIEKILDGIKEITDLVVQIRKETEEQEKEIEDKIKSKHNIL